MCLRDKDAHENWSEKSNQGAESGQCQKLQKQIKQKNIWAKSKQQIKEEEASWVTASRLEYVITGFAAW